MATKNLIAVDLGAESGRLILATWNGRKLTTREIYRFPNGPLRWNGSFRWNVVELWAQILKGLTVAAKETGGKVDSISVDSWGVDFAWLDKKGELLGLPYCYRDSRTDGIYEKAFRIMPRERIYDITGIQFMSINTFPQMLAAKWGNPALLEASSGFLMIAEFFLWLLSGERVCEYTLASTSQMLDARTGDWSKPLLRAFGIPARLCPPVVASGTKLGKLRKDVAEATGLRNTQVIATASHDTGAAVAGIPSTGEDWAFISSGTWSLIGTVLPKPCITQEGAAANLTNEGGAGGGIRYLKNVVGLWLLQESRRIWEAQGRKLGYAELTAMAQKSPTPRTLLDVNDPALLKPGDMPARINAQLKRKGGAPVKDVGAMTRLILESLAAEYGVLVRDLTRITGKRLTRMHIIGGGSQNQLLNRLTQERTGLKVLVGPTEATSLGNLAIQLATQEGKVTPSTIAAFARRFGQAKTLSP
jgi:rhamnulokinase